MNVCTSGYAFLLIDELLHIVKHFLGFLQLGAQGHTQTSPSNISYNDHSPSVGPRGSILPLGVVMIIAGRALSKTLFFSCVSWLKYYPRSYNLFYVDIIIYF